MSDQASRPVTVKAIQDGPLQIKGRFRLLDPTGEEYDLEGRRVVLLCRCGRSGDQPFCDASHRATDFRSDDRPVCAADAG